MKSAPDLKKLANRLRIDALQMVNAAQAGHPGGSLSILDLLTALYFGGFARVNAKKPADPARDFVILSKAHASPALYSVLAELGFFSRKEFGSFRQVSSLLQGHACAHVPGIELSGGGLGQGLSAAVGIALGLRIDAKPNRVFCLLGDGELQEGQNWEAAMTATKYRLGNLTAIVDQNELQIDGATADVMPLGSLAEKFRAFGFEVVEIDGHDFGQISQAYSAAIEPRSAPLAIIARTVKGKGAPAAEGNYEYHGKPLRAEELADALDKLSKLC